MRLICCRNTLLVDLLPRSRESTDNHKLGQAIMSNYRQDKGAALLSNNQVLQHRSLEYFIDESTLVLSSSECMATSTLRIPNTLLTPLIDTLLKDPSQIFNLISDHPLPLISSHQGIIHRDTETQPSEWTKIEDDTDYDFLNSALQSSSMYLLRQRSGKASTTLDIVDQEPIDELKLVSTHLNYGVLGDIEEAIPAREIISAVIIGEKKFPIDDLQFHDESLVSHILVRSKALGDHVLCTSTTEGLSDNCRFMGCFALIDVLLVAKGDVERARRLLDLAAERATLVRDYIDLVRAAELLDCSSVVTDALVRRAILALHDDDRNVSLNLPLTPELALICCSSATRGETLARELLDQLLMGDADQSILQEAAEIARQHLNDQNLAHSLNEAALRASKTHAGSN